MAPLHTPTDLGAPLDRADRPAAQRLADNDADYVTPRDMLAELCHDAGLTARPGRRADPDSSPESNGGSTMKQWIVGCAASGVVLGGLWAAGSASAASKQVDQITCEEFLTLDPDNQNRIAYWVDGYAQAKNEAEVGTVALDKFGQPIRALVEDCKKTPKETLWQKLKKHL
jgi:hypothetical protein